MFKNFFSEPIIGAVIKDNLNSLIKVYSLNILEAVFSLLIPTSVGVMINSLISHSGYGVFIFILCYVLFQLTALFRRILDTKIFTLIYNQFVEKLIDKTNSNDFSIINARIELLKQVVSYFENDLPILINSIITILGSGVILFFYSTKLLFASLIIIIPSFIINQYYFKKISKLTEKINDQYENQLSVLKQENNNLTSLFFQNLRKLNISKSNQEAYNFAFLEIFVFTMIFISVVIICNTENVKPGTIVASYAIILKFAYSFDFIPYITLKFASIKDIFKRIKN